MKYNKCNKCKFNNRSSTIFPCTNCDKNEQPPITCFDCRYHPCGKKKSIRICDKFYWW